MWFVRLTSRHESLYCLQLNMLEKEKKMLYIYENYASKILK